MDFKGHPKYDLFLVHCSLVLYPCMLVFCCIVVMTGSGWGARCVSCAHVFAHAHQHVHTRKHTNNMAQVLKKSCKGRERKNREETEAQNNTWERSNHQIKIRAQGKRQTKKKSKQRYRRMRRSETAICCWLWHSDKSDFLPQLPWQPGAAAVAG